MGLLSFFRKKPEAVIESITERTVAGAIAAQSVLSELNENRAPYVGAEVAHLFMQLIDRQLFSELGPSRRNVIYEEIANKVVASYTLKAFSPIHLHISPQGIAVKMMDTLNSRQETYSRCSSLLGDQFPGPGSMAFALSFFIHQVLGHTTRGNVGEILSGNKPIPDGEMNSFPGIEEILRTTMYVGSAYKEVGIKKGEFRHLR